MDYREALHYIEGVSWLGSKPGLERVSALLARVGDPQDALRVVHVAGTNGKGSTAAMLASVLRGAGYKTGLYTSPHLLRMNERMKINGEEITDGAFAAVVSRLAAGAERLPDPCTEFELVTAAAFLWFAQEACDAAVVEVGLGGRLDATNVIGPPACAVITNIGLDHTEVLGDTVEKIAAEKAGILKGGPAVSYAEPPSVAAVLRAAAERAGSELTFADFGALESLSDTRDGQVFRYRGVQYALPLLGRNQLKNAATALTAVEALRRAGWNLPEDAVKQGLAGVVWPARFEIVSRTPYFVVDGGHNPQCIASTAENLRDYFPDMRRVLLVGVLADKDWHQMTDLLAPLADAFVAVTPDSPRALPAGELARALAEYGRPVRACETIPEGVRAARELAGPAGVVCSAGSLYMAGAVRACFGLE